MALVAVALLLLPGACASDDSNYTSSGTAYGRASAPPPKLAPNTPRPVPEPRTKPSVPSRAAPVAASPGMVVVAKGDTVYALARRYGVPPKEIIEANRLSPPYHLEVGQRLRLPAGEKHRVQKGDTVYSISRQYGVDMSELTRVNNIRPPYRISVGQQLNVPQRTRSPLPEWTGRTVGKETARIALPTPPPRSGAGFTWPARGRILSTFGPKEGGRHNDGINIALARGTDVLAAESGVVVYAGNELKGFGNLILIRHSGGWVSAYGHSDQMLVSRGQNVKRGQVIAKAGSSGSVVDPQLHFELRKGTRAVDPRKYLPPA